MPYNEPVVLQNGYAVQHHWTGPGRGGRARRVLYTSCINPGDIALVGVRERRVLWRHSTRGGARRAIRAKPRVSFGIRRSPGTGRVITTHAAVLPGQVRVSSPPCAPTRFRSKSIFSQSFKEK